MNIAYLTCDGILDSVFDSQVMGLIAELENRGIGVDLYSARGPRRNLNPELNKKIQEIKGRLQGDLRHIWYLRYLGNWSTVVSRLSFMRALDSSRGYTMVHCRGSYSGYVAVRSFGSRLPVLTDVRGVIAEESQVRGNRGSFGRWVRNSAWRNEALKSLERVSVEGARAVSCVSSPLRNYLLERYSLKPENVIVVPGCVDTSLFRSDEASRREVREELGFSGKRVFLYVGSVKAWQIPHTICGLFRRALEQDGRSRLLVLTQEPGAMRAFLEREKIGPEFAAAMGVPHSEVGRYIRAADVGLMLREKNLVNEVACPTKFGEYISSGVPVLATVGVGDTQAHIEAHRLGWLIDDIHDESQIAEKVKEVLGAPEADESERDRITGVGRSLFKWSAHIPKLLELYGRAA